MWGLLIGLGLMITDLIIQACKDGPPLPAGANEIKLPTIADGAPYPLIYGRGRVRQPVNAWVDTSVQVLRSSGALNFYDYYLSMHFVLGAGFLDGKQNIYNVWAGESPMYQISVVPSVAVNLGSLVGDGNFEDAAPSHRQVTVALDSNPGAGIGVGQVLASGMVEFLNGNTSQLVVDDVSAYAALTRLGQHQTVAQTVSGSSTYGLIDPQRCVSYRGLMSVFMAGTGATGHFYIGTSPQAPTFSFEASSYPVDSSYPSQGLYQKIGNDANPIDVIYDVLTGKFGKLGLDPSLIDMPSFQAAAYALWSETHGYSRMIEQGTSGADIIQEILVQIAGSLYEEPTTGKLVVKLIRSDFDPTTIPVIDASNANNLKVTCGGWVNLPNKIRIVYTDAINDYQDGSATAQNMANAVGQDGLVREQVLEMRGITNIVTARNVAARELAARSAPLMTISGELDRSFIRLRPGDPVRVNWSSPDIAGMVFRVVSPARGTLADGRIQMDLVQDPFYVWRNAPPAKTDFGSHDAGGGRLGFGF